MGLRSVGSSFASWASEGGRPCPCSRLTAVHKVWGRRHSSALAQAVYPLHLEGRSTLKRSKCRTNPLMRKLNFRDAVLSDGVISEAQHLHSTLHHIHTHLNVPVSPPPPRNLLIPTNLLRQSRHRMCRVYESLPPNRRPLDLWEAVTITTCYSIAR
eukprot:1186546-Prorocentrum_minimum.AAC.1